MFGLILLGFYSNAASQYKIGFSQCTTSDLWRQTQLRLMEIEVSFYPNMELVVKDAKDDTQTQIKQIEELVKEGIDLLIVSPNESEPLSPIVEKVFQSGIPVIVIDRNVDTDQYSAFIGGDNFVIGIEAANYVVKLLHGKGKVLEIKGLEGSSPAQDRHDGFVSVLNTYPEIEIVQSVSGDWKKESAKRIVSEAISNNVDFDVVFAHNDVMAKEVYNITQMHRNTRDVFILGVDGLPGTEGGIQMVIDNIIDATFMYQTGGGLAIQTAYDLLNKNRVSKENIIPSITINKDNAPTIKAQSDQIEILHNKIERQKLLLTIETNRNKIQRLILFLLLIGILLIAVVVILININLKSKKKANKLLIEKNNEIENQNELLKKQHDQLVQIDKELQEATQTKLTFFTNISHEFKTPLTLIKGPLENLMEDKVPADDVPKMYRIMYRNTERLLQMIHQLMDFRKLENKKMKIKTSENVLKDFISDVFDSFKFITEDKKIKLTLENQINSTKVWFDCDKIEKVLFNVLSNSIKFTPENGQIAIKVSKQKVHNPGLFSEEVCIKISDNGSGIPANILPNIFDRFYHSKESRVIKGTGIGLNFSKQLIELHRGRIEIKSTEGNGTKVYVFLPIGNLHLLDEEMVSEKSCDRLRTPSADILHSEQFEAKNGHIEIKGNNNSLPTILIVEDMPDVLDFVKTSLGHDYTIVTASNGKEGIQKVLHDEPDLIISDVMMPIMDGFEMTRRLKSGTETSHIPIILLSAKTSAADKIEGYEGGADNYVEKPFNSSVLKSRVDNLLKSRKQLREHYLNTLEFNGNSGDLNQLDKKFLDKLRKIILDNIGKQELSIDELAGKLGISRVHLYRKVKKLTDMSVSEFVISVKLKSSLELLRTSGKTITEIAYESGFSSQSYYTRCFKDQFKISPSDYIKQTREKI
ncbi:substrate-binding domain-containing protein [uncultured Draconibacterium sp.]